MLPVRSKSSALLVWMISCVALTAGCTPFGGDPPPVINTKPTKAQVRFCRAAMYINFEAEITPLGYFYQKHFLDDEAAFKFSVSTDSPSSIFQKEFVQPEKLTARDPLGELNGGDSPEWWKPSSKSLIGGDFTVPPPESPGNRGLCIGISDNEDGTYTVYVRWFET